MAPLAPILIKKGYGPDKAIDRRHIFPAVAMIQIPYRVPYKLRMGSGIFLTVLGAVFAGGAYKLAIFNHQCLLLDNLIHLNVRQATDFYWFLTLFFAVGIAFAICRIITGLMSPTYLELTQTELRIGKTVIPYAEITSLQTRSRRSKEHGLFVRIGKTSAFIQRIMLPDDESYQDVKQFLTSRLR